MFTPALRKESSWTRLFIMSISNLIDVKILSEGVNVISVPDSFEALTLESLVFFFPSEYFCWYMPPSLQIVKTNSLDSALTTETPTP